MVFRNEIGHALLQCYRVFKKRSRLSSSRQSTPESRIVKTQKGVNCGLVDDVILNNKHHWLVHITAKMRCRIGQVYSLVACEKCNVALCLNMNRNYFKLLN